MRLYAQQVQLFTKPIGGSYSQNLTLDSSGNLGLGVTPSATSAAFRAFEVGNFTFFSGTGGLSSYIDNNAFFNTSGQYCYKNNGYAGEYAMLTSDGSHRWYTAPSGTANSASVTSGASYTVVALGSSTLAQWQAFFNDSSNNPLTVTPTLGQVLTGNATGTLLGGGLVTQNISFTQAMTLDASGNLGVGQTNPSAWLVNGIGIGSGTADWGATIYTGTSSSGYLCFADGTTTTDRYRGYLQYSHATDAMVFATAATERARITSGGIFIVGGGNTYSISGGQLFDVTANTSGILAGITQSNTTASNGCFGLWQKATSGDNVFQEFFTDTAGTSRGSITYNRGGGLVAYNTTSDYRAKDITGPVANSGATIDALKVYNGKMKGATVERPMLIAHEAQEITPYAVTGEKDAVNDDGTPKYQQMDVSSLVPLLIAEIQSLRARVAQLEGK
jgi:hypothetical protein